jgi:hypothetical protein
MQIQAPAPATSLDLSRDEWRDVFHLGSDELTTSDDVVHSGRIAGGFRLSTVAAPLGSSGAAQSATVHIGEDRITMRGDGTYTVDGGAPVDHLKPGDGAVLRGGEMIGVARDGSIGVTADGAPCRTMVALLRGTGDGVDVRIEAGLNPYCETPLD